MVYKYVNDKAVYFRAKSQYRVHWRHRTSDSLRPAQCTLNFISPTTPSTTNMFKTIWIFTLILSLLFLSLPSYCIPALNSKSFQCEALSFALGDKVSYPISATYKNSTKSYFSAFENELRPTCVVAPTSTKDVALILSTLKQLKRVAKIQLAIRGGGHTPFAGSANINEGVTVDMRSMRGIKISHDRKITSIGAGEIWGNVYRKLDAMGLSVSGGRVSETGVAGLTTGGMSISVDSEIS